MTFGAEEPSQLTTAAERQKPERTDCVKARLVKKSKKPQEFDEHQRDAEARQKPHNYILEAQLMT